MSRLRAALSALLFLALLVPQTARAEIGQITDSGTFDRPAQSQFLALYGEDTCSVTISGTGTNFAITPAISVDGGKTYQAVTTIGGGNITATGTYSGAVPVINAQYINGFFLAQRNPINGSISYSVTCTGAVPISVLPFQVGQQSAVLADGSASFSVTYGTAFANTYGAITVTPSAYSGTDNAAITCRVTAQSLSGFSGICAGGQSGSTVTVNYHAYGT